MTKPSLVVCVEDDEPVRDALRGLLRASGINAASFSSAEEFLDSDELQTATCLVTDIQLGGISGLDLLDRLAGMSLDIPSILITAHTDVAAGDRARSSGAMRPQQDACECRRQGQRVQGGDRRGHGNGHRELLVELSGYAGDEGGRRENGDQNKRDGQHGRADLVHGDMGSFLG